MNTSALNIGQTHAGNVCVVTLTGRIDSTNANDVMTELTRLISAGEKLILVDFASVLYLTSAAFRALLVATDDFRRIHLRGQIVTRNDRAGPQSFKESSRFWLWGNPELLGEHIAAAIILGKCRGEPAALREQAHEVAMYSLIPWFYRQQAMGEVDARLMFTAHT